MTLAAAAVPALEWQSPCRPPLPTPACPVLPSAPPGEHTPRAQVIRSLWGPNATEDDCVGRLKVSYRRLPRGAPTTAAPLQGAAFCCPGPLR